jgi:hypothetical protein
MQELLITDISYLFTGNGLSSEYMVVQLYAVDIYNVFFYNVYILY